MDRKYWKSQKYPGFIRERRANLDLLLSLVNTDLDAAENEALTGFIKDYFKFITIGISSVYEEPLREKHLDYAEELIKSAPSPEITIELKNFARAIQFHISLRIQAIIGASMLLVETMAWEMTGKSLKINIDPFNNRFLAKFSFGDIKSENHLEDGKRLFDLNFIEIISELDLKPRRFRQCQKCRAFFYQPTSREKVFCSPRCAGAVRQARFQKKGGDSTEK